MSKYDKVKVGEKLPGTYCPVCGEVGLKKVKEDGIEWAICPMNAEMEPTAKLKDAHTGYQLDPKAVISKPASPKLEAKIEKKVEGVDDA